MQSYIVTLKIYGGSFEETPNLTWEEAKAKYNSIAIPSNWTRHSSCKSEISHMNTKFNLFNEGALKLEPMES